MAKGYLDTPRHTSSYSVAYPQGRPWSVGGRSVVVPLLLAGLALWAAATAAAALGAAWHALSGAAGHSRPKAAATKYVLVIDSGSSGTRMYAYNWTLPVARQQGAAGSILPVLHPIPPSAAPHLVPKKEKKGLYNRVETQPGLDTFLGNSAGLASAAIGPLLAWARAVVPPAQHAATPLFLLGTGGLRRLELHARAALMADVRKLLAGSEFRFDDAWARVISGTEEGMYGWLALNYEQGLLQQQLAAATSRIAAAPGAAPVTLGILGASTSLGALDLGFSAKYDRLAYDGAAARPTQVVLRGRPSWRNCLALVDAVVNASAPCQPSAARPACRLGSALPEHQGSFLALTGFYVVAKFLGVPHDAPLGALLDASKELCARPWPWVSEHLGSNINVERYCTWGPYVVKLLRHGLRLKDSAVRVGSGDVGWAQVLWGGRQGIHMGHVFGVFVCVAVWLSVVVYCLPARVGAVGLSVLPVVLRGLQGPGKAQFVLPVAAHAAHRGRSRPMSSPLPGRTSGKYAGV
ncbi:hypothetical protein OEZ85_012097 [Tetradesmus obliquus]|uniref:Uncharacterized protein n=1 Tax=Tetradesmus obliquus TaxID=3088 RepID=A0ABY8TWA2_TETOB|nr:hypothetical protein OEZ85_012097 [Tetradesmus obliquus]